MRNFLFRNLVTLRENYWFWPAVMTASALMLGFLLPFVDSVLGSEWTHAIGFLRATRVDGARAILTTLAGATLGVAGVAFSITIVAVSFATANYGPRLIGNFMADRTNQIVLGIFVATFVYCITVLTTVHSQAELEQGTLEAFVPQISILFSLILTLVSVAALIIYIHHIPDSINIMNVTATIGRKLQTSIVALIDEEHAEEIVEPVAVAAWETTSGADRESTIRATSAGFLQQIDLESLHAIARARQVQISIERSVGEFFSVHDVVMTVRPGHHADERTLASLHQCYTIGAERTDVQDVLFLSDQLVEVLMRALSPGVNDPHTAMLCLDWLRAGLVAFARRPPVRQAAPDAPVLYRRVTLEAMLDRSFDRMRQYVSADRNVALYALHVLADVAMVASREGMIDACTRQMERLARSAREQLAESLARGEVEAALGEALRRLADRRG